MGAGVNDVKLSEERSPAATKHGHGGGSASQTPSAARMCSRVDAKCRRYWSQRTTLKRLRHPRSLIGRELANRPSASYHADNVSRELLLL